MNIVEEVIEVGNRRTVSIIGPSLIKTLQLRLKVIEVMSDQQKNPYQIIAAPFDEDGASIASVTGTFISGLSSEVSRLLTDLRKTGVQFVVTEVQL